MFNFLVTGPCYTLNNQVYAEVSIAAKDTYIIDMEKLILENGDSLRAKDDTGAVTTVTVSYVSI